MAMHNEKPILRITVALYDQLRSHGEQTYPEECCGILLGSSEKGANTVLQLIPAPNVSTSSTRHHYQIAPADLIAAQKQGRAQDLEIVGFYHSHPDHPAEWSLTDLAEAHWLGTSYVITSIQRGRAQDTRSFRLAGEQEESKQLVEEALVVVDSLLL